MDFCEIDMEEEDEVTPEDEAYCNCVDMLLEKFPEAKHRKGTLDDIPKGKYYKLCYSAIHDEYYDYLIRGFMICAIDKETKSDAIIYRSDNP